MFRELLPVLRDRAVLLTVTLVDADQIRGPAVCGLLGSFGSGNRRLKDIHALITGCRP